VGAACLLGTLLLTARAVFHNTITETTTAEVLMHLIGLSTFLLLFFLLDSGSLGSRLLAMPVLRYLGLISYEWFLFHQPAIAEFRKWMGAANGDLGRYLFTVGSPMVLSLGAAALVYHFYSMPIIKWGRKRFAPREKAHVVLVPEVR
jgi:peptidoglycan/LPS O-acetylase OafA/YrhL